MAVIKPFAGYRPSEELAARVAAPPYDVINSAEAREMAAGNPCSFLHINKPEIDLPAGTDPYDQAVYLKGAENLQRFIEEGILRQDEAPCFYLYRQVMGTHEQTGLVALASVDEYENGLIKKHEHTRPGKEDDRVRHMDRLNAQVGPVFLTYRAQQEIDEMVTRSCEESPEFDFVSEDGIRHVFWQIADTGQKARITELFARLPVLYVADGHHRSAAACRVRDIRRQANPHHSGEESYNYFLTVLFPHDQMQILDYNRVVRDLNDHTPADFLHALEQTFNITTLDQPARPDREHTFTLYLDHHWYRLELDERFVDSGDPVARLDVSLLQQYILGPLLGITDPRTDDRIDFVGGIRGTEELVRLVDSGEHMLAFACYPTSVENLMAIADAGEIMPPKSTWFEPKLKSGLVTHRLDER